MNFGPQNRNQGYTTQSGGDANSGYAASGPSAQGTYRTQANMHGGQSGVDWSQLGHSQGGFARPQVQAPAPAPMPMAQPQAVGQPYQAQGGLSPWRSAGTARSQGPYAGGNRGGAHGMPGGYANPQQAQTQPTAAAQQPYLGGNRSGAHGSPNGYAAPVQPQGGLTDPSTWEANAQRMQAENVQQIRDHSAQMRAAGLDPNNLNDVWQFKQTSAAAPQSQPLQQSPGFVASPMSEEQRMAARAKMEQQYGPGVMQMMQEMEAQNAQRNNALQQRLGQAQGRIAAQQGGTYDGAGFGAQLRSMGRYMPAQPGANPWSAPYAGAIIS